MHGAIEGGGGVIAKDEPLEEELDILEHPFAANQTLVLVLSIKGRGQLDIAITDELFIKISLSALSVSSSQKLHIRLN